MVNKLRAIRSELEQAVGQCSERIKAEEVELQNYQLKLIGLDLKINGIIHLNNATYVINQVIPPDIKGCVGIDNWRVKFRRTHIPKGVEMPEELILEVE